MTTNPELAKYQKLFASANFNRYGHNNHGKRAARLVRWLHPENIVDLGCGHNEFAKTISPVSCTGVDFACPSANVRADILALPFTRQQFDLATAFDVLEHLRPEQVRPALLQIRRVSKQFVFSMSTVPSVYKVDGETLHPTVRPLTWWETQIASVDGIVKRWGNYLYGTWKPRPVETGETVAVVGNAPNILATKQGAEIDAHNQVIRFNRYVTCGFEDYTGSKTTLWSTFGRGELPNQVDDRVDSCPMPERAIYIHGETWKTPPDFIKTVYGIPRQFFNEMTARVRAFPGVKSQTVICTSGLLVVHWLLEKLDVPCVDLYGFNHFNRAQDKRHHYFNPRKFGQPSEHDGNVEAAMFRQLADTGRVRYSQPPTAPTPAAPWAQIIPAAPSAPTPDTAPAGNAPWAMIPPR
jgi:hypothetical protein